MARHVLETHGVYGMLAEFESPEALVHAARGAYAAGYRRMDGYSPYPIEEVAEAIGVHSTGVPWLVLGGGLAGAAGGFALQWWVSVWHYPLNVGGRPLFSWPAFVPVTFESTVLLAALSAVIGMLALNGLPRPYHPVFGAEGFERATEDRFFLCIEAEDPMFDRAHTRRFLDRFHPQRIQEVRHAR